MKREELKSIIKECLDELFEENEMFMRIMTEALKTSISATLKESMSLIPRTTITESVPQQQSKPRGGIERKQKFDPAEFFNQGGLEEVKTIMAGKSLIEEEKTAHQAMIDKINEKIPDEMIFGTDFKQKMQQYIKKK